MFVLKGKNTISVSASKLIFSTMSIPGKKAAAYNFHSRICGRTIDFNETVILHLLSLPVSNQLKHICGCYSKKQGK